MRYLLTSLFCVFTLSLTAQEACPNTYDGDEDGVIGISDLLGLLAVFGDTDSDYDGVFDSEDDCIDVTACNYQSNPTLICAYYDVIGVCGGYCLTDDDGDGVCDWEVFNSCGDQIEHEGYEYSTVLIGEQCWFSENCRYLPEVSPSSEGSDTSPTEPYYYVYDYQGTDVEAAKSTDNYETYGVLYNWPAVMTEGICPTGWHIPSDGEWQTMEISLGMSESEAAGTGWRGTDEGYQMKSSSGWYDSGNGSNSSGFNGLPGGFRYSVGFVQGGYNGEYGYWWSASESGSISWDRKLASILGSAYRGNHSRHYAYSARCVRD